MKTKLIVFGIMVSILPFVANAQQTKPKTKKSNQTSTTESTMPSWGQAHNYQNDKYVYFPDYYTFYSPSRGYTYWNNGSWSSSTNLPSNMSNADLNFARVQKLDNARLNSYPEKNFSNYMGQYPAQPVNGTILPAPQVR